MNHALVTILAGLALASSWTWVIGMYLPRIMLERFGWVGFFVFAVPNVLGCAAFGRVVGTDSDLKERTSDWARWFSCVTISFHLAFCVFLLRTLLPDDGSRLSGWATYLIPMVLLLIGLVVSHFNLRQLIWIGAAVWCFALLVFFSSMGEPLHIQLTSSPSQAWYLLPMMVGGFLICPYLDLTFHEIRGTYPKQSFDVFGIAFSLMLGLTVLIWMSAPPHLNGLALAHLGIQSVFTIAFHLEALQREESRVQNANGFGLRGILIPSCVALLASFAISGHRSADEVWYLRFLYLYGAIFPAGFLLSWFLKGRSLFVAMLIFVAVTAYPAERCFVQNEPIWALIPGAGLAVVALLALFRTTGNKAKMSSG